MMSILPVKSSSAFTPVDVDRKTGCYLANLLTQFHDQLFAAFPIASIFHLIRLGKWMEQDYRKRDIIGKGYHCLEHSVELSAIVLDAWKNPCLALPYLSPFEKMELAIAALLHDYDPFQTREMAPKMEWTVDAIRNSVVIKKVLEHLGVDLDKIVLLIERTDYPFTDQEAAWNRKASDYFAEAEERQRFADVAEALAILDKASTYFSLTPLQAEERVRGLAIELQLPESSLLPGTIGFLQKESISAAIEWLPNSYRQRWEKVKKHFEKIAETSDLQIELS